MNSVDLSRLESRNLVNEAHEVVGVWEFEIEGLEKLLKVKVGRHNMDEHPFMGVANLKVNNYISLAFQATIEEAINDSLRGFLAFYNPEDEDILISPYNRW